MGRIRYVVLICMFWAAIQAHSQGGLATRPPAAPEYVLGPGDQVVFHVIDMEEISDKPVRVDPNGFVDIPEAGHFKVSGLTIEQFKAELSTRLSKYITNPKITVGLTEDHSRPVSIIGSVNSPGLHELPGPKHLIDVIAMAGGIRGDAGYKVIVTREQKWGKIPLPNAIVDQPTGMSIAWVSVDDLQASRNPADNILIMPNDIITIPRAEVVYVLGTVHKPGGFELSSHPTISLLQALSLAGGSDRDASLKDAKIIRPSKGDGKPIEIPVNISKILHGDNSDFPLLGNDVLYLPSSGAKVTLRRAGDILQLVGTAAVYRF
jgi:polysaccharide export outer membrane protein